MLQGIDTLQGLKQTSGETSECYSFQSTTIKNSSLNKGIDLYTLAVHKFMGNSIIKRLEGAPFSDLNDLHDRLKLTDSLGEGEWIDLSGLIVPKQAVKDEIDRIVGNPDSTLRRNRIFLPSHASALLRHGMDMGLFDNAPLVWKNSRQAVPRRYYPNRTAMERSRCVARPNAL